MYRHTQKQTVRTQEWLSKRAVNTLDGQRQELCNSIYTNTYERDLPQSSIDMLSNVVLPLTGCRSNPNPHTRSIFTVCTMQYNEHSRYRLCFIQPEIASATAHVPQSYTSMISRVKGRLLKELNNPAPASISSSAETCQVQGRMAPYIIDGAGATGVARWAFCNAAKSRFVYIVSSQKGVDTMSLTKEAIQIVQSFCVEDCAIIYMGAMNCFKITAAPDEEDRGNKPNKSTCMFLYCDGVFKAVGTPHKIFKVCRLLRESIIAAHKSYMHKRLVESLVPLGKVVVHG
jgi:hypothetical protein